MKRLLEKLISGITTLSLCVSMIGVIPTSAESAFGGGDGTSVAPYIISTEAHLKQLAGDVDGGNEYSGKYFKMTQDITLSGEWDSIGNKYEVTSEDKYFAGVFDGDGHKISGLSQNISSSGSMNDSGLQSDNFGRGLFALNKGTIKNLAVNGNINIYGTDVYESVGGVVSANEGIVENCSYEGKLQFSESLYGLKPIGGVVGKNDGTVRECYNSANIEITLSNCDIFVGGVVGENTNNSILTNCYNTGTITIKNENTNVGYTYSGGVTGFTNSTVINCYNTGTINDTSDNSSIGQITGYGTANNSYYPNAPIAFSSVDNVAELLGDDIALMADYNDGAIAKSPEAFESGEVAYLLNGGADYSSHEWRQTLNSDALPVLEESHPVVCYNEGIYSNAYPITFLNYDGTVLKVINTEAGEIPEYGGIPTRPAEGTIEYTFSGWSPEITAVTGPASYTAQYSGRTTELNTGRKLYVDYMGESKDADGLPDDVGQTYGNLNKDNENDKFWVGVAVDNASNLPLFTSGVYSLEVAFEYDPDFVEPYTTTTSPTDDWKIQLEKGNFADSNNSLWWNENQYEIISVTDTKLDTTNDREDKGLLQDREGWRMCTVCITFNPKDDAASAADKRFKNLSDDDKQYLLKLPFKLKKAPKDTDADQNPTVLSLVRGPETLDIGSGELGTDPYSAWEATITDPNDATNMKTLFNFNGDVKLFGEAASISNIIPVKPKTGEETDDTTYTLSQTKQLQLEGFNAEKDTYYLTVLNETEKLRLDITSSVAPTVTFNGSAINTSLKNQLYVTDEFNLDVVNKDTANGGEEDGFNNIVVVTINGKPYTIHIRRYVKPYIRLNYGNSPYGEIMKADNIAKEDKEAAKEAFDAGNVYAKPYIPTAVEHKIAPQGGSLNLSTNIMWYPYRAWVDIEDMSKATDQQLADLDDPDINMDRNDYAIFVYNNKYFVEPGFTAIDSMGDPVKNVTRKITVNKMTQGLKIDGIYEGNYVSKTIEIKDKPSDYLITEITMPYDESTPEKATETALIRPDIYKMYYSFIDPVTGNEVKYEEPDIDPETGKEVMVEKPRYVIVLQSRGDTNFSLQINLQDVNPIYQYFNKQSTYFKTEGEDHVITGTARQIYLYRCLDLRASDQVNLQDVNPIYQFFNRYDKLTEEQKASNNNPLEEWYVELPDNIE